MIASQERHESQSPNITRNGLSSPNAILKTSQLNAKKKNLKIKKEKSEKFEIDETQHNLYWTESLSLPCLWYGEELGKEHDFKVLVVVIGKVNNGKARSTKVSLPREELLPLERAFLRKCTDGRVKDFTSALLDFHLWDDSRRDSYHWPQYIDELICSPTQLFLWLDAADKNEASRCIKSRRRLYLFILCSQALGIEQEYRVGTDGKDYCSDAVRDLIENIHELGFRTASHVSSENQVDCLPDVKNSLIPTDDEEPYLTSSLISDLPAADFTLSPSDIGGIYVGQAIFAPVPVIGNASAGNGETLSAAYEMNTYKQIKYFLSIVLRIDNPSSSASFSSSSSTTTLVDIVQDTATAAVMDLTSDDAASPSPAEIVETKVPQLYVYDGTRKWVVPISICRRIVSQRDEEEAKVELLSVALDDQATRTVWTAREFDVFLSGLKKHEDDLYAVWRYMKFLLGKESANNAGIRSQKSFKDVISLYHLFNQSEEFLHFFDSPKPHRKTSKLVKNGHKSTTASGASNKSTVVKRSVSVPNRWPSTLPMIRHNIYWLKSHQCPCVCLGLQADSLMTPGDGLLKILPISMTSNQYTISVSHGCVGILTLESLRQCDDRTTDFVHTLIKFSEYELVGSKADCKWYFYPDFVISLLSNTMNWSAWRNQAERAMRGKGDRRQAYFDMMVEESRTRAREDKRTFGCNLPWDDEPLILDEEEESSVNASDSSFESDEVYTDDNTKPKPKKARIDKTNKSDMNKTSKKPDMKPASSVAPVIKKEPSKHVVPVVPVDPLAHRRSPLNLYWIDRSQLPCLFYDDAERETADSFRVLPICCTTYHYDVEIHLRQLDPLTESRLSNVNDERTREFALALIDFALWDTKRIHGTDSVLSKQSYQWPSYVLNLISRPREWSTWRTMADRRATKGKLSKRRSYFVTMQEEYLSTSEAEDYLDSTDVSFEEDPQPPQGSVSNVGDEAKEGEEMKEDMNNEEQEEPQEPQEQSMVVADDEDDGDEDEEAEEIAHTHTTLDNMMGDGVAAMTGLTVVEDCLYSDPDEGELDADTPVTRFLPSGIQSP